MGKFLYDKDFRHERVKWAAEILKLKKYTYVLKAL